MESKITHLLVPTDFSPCSKLAMEKALPLARQCGAAITLLHVVDVNYHIPQEGPASADMLRARLEAEGRERLGAAARELTKQGVELRTLLDEGLPCESICDIARKCDLIVIGKRKPKPFWSWFSRRTLERVLDQAPCPVLVVPESKPHARNQSFNTKSL